MLRHSRRANEARERGQRSAHFRPWPLMKPPAFPMRLLPVLLDNRADSRFDMRKWRFVGCGFGLSHPHPEVDDEHVARAPRHVHAVHRRHYHVCICAVVDVGRLQQHPAGNLTGYIERPSLDVSLEANLFVLTQAPGLCDIDTAGQVAVDRCNRLPVQRALRFRAVVLPDDRDAHGGAIDDPRLVRPRHEDVTACLDAIERGSVRPAADRVRRQQTGAPRDPGGDLPARQLVPVAREVRLADDRARWASARRAGGRGR